ncbi:unnamed protein product, partial [Hymenolepis diminuta]
MLWCGLTQVTHRKLPLFLQTAHTGQLRTPTRPVHLLSSSARCSPSFSPSLCYSLHAALPLSLPLSVTHCGFLEYMFGLLN